jgi:vacuolar-type H+-ATPase subunit H
LAKEKTTHVDVPPASSLSAVESIVSALSSLENDIDGLYVRADEMKKRIMAHSNEEVDKLKQQITMLANEEAKKIVDSAKAEADSESEKIAETERATIASLKKNINSSFDKAVDSIVKTVLGDTIQSSPKPEPRPTTSAKIKKYTADGKPAN